MYRRTLAFLLTLFLLLPCFALAEAPDSSPAEAAPSPIEEAVFQFLQEDFQKQAEAETDEWRRFIYNQGVDAITMDLEKFDISAEKPVTANFMISAGAPAFKSLPKYENNPAEWLKGVADSMSAHSSKAKASVLVTEENGAYTVAYAPKAEAALQKSIKALATKAKEAFASKALLTALTDYLMPSPIALPKKAPKALAAEEYRPVFTDYLTRNDLVLEDDLTLPALFYGIRNTKLNLSGGPNALVMTYNSPDTETLFDDASTSLWKTIRYEKDIRDYTSEQLTEKLNDQITTDIIAYRHGKASNATQSYTFDLLDLPTHLNANVFYPELLPSPEESFSEALLSLRVEILLMPDYPPVPNPKTGLMTGGKKGTKVILDGRKLDYDRCEMIYDLKENLVASVFVNANTRATIYLPKGDYIFVSGIGDTWYGPERLFGKYGYYENAFHTVPSTKYYYTIQYNAGEARGKWKSIDSTELDYNSLSPQEDASL